MTVAASAQIGVTGLGVMGRNLARNFARHGYATALHNRTASKTDAIMEEFGHEGTFVPAHSAEDFVASLERPRRLVIMVNAGAATDAVIEEFAPLLEPGDMIIDAGNAHFLDTRRREAALRDQGLHFVGMGVSGGEEGALNGPSIMPGGSLESYESLGPMLEKISAKVDGTPCATHVGPDGAGHFVKMVHNGIEYADMQLIAEAYDLLRYAGGYSPAEIADIFRTWNTGRLDSYLIEITAEVLAHTDAKTGGPFVDVVLDQAEQKGTGRWTVQTALDLGVPIDGIAEATFARSLSGHADLRAAARGFAGPDRAVVGDPDAFADKVEQALYASKIVSYAQGWNMIAAGSEEYDWDIDLGKMAVIWRGGCIIRAAFLDRIRAAYAGNPELPTLLADPDFGQEVTDAQTAWRDVVATAVGNGIPVPGFSAALAYYDALRAERLPAALVQGLRDFFGTHTYRRTDADGSFHTLWAEDRSEVSRLSGGYQPVSGGRAEVAAARLWGKLSPVNDGDLRRRAAELGVSVSYWDWHGRENIVPDETLAAIVAVLSDSGPAAGGGFAVPDTVAPVPGQRSWGFTVQLYSLRSRASWGHGDLRDLADFASWSARDLGAGFVLINPLHAAEPLPPISPSPYLPMSRRWVSPLYLRIEDIPEYEELTSAERTRLTVLSAPLRAASATPALIERDAVWAAKREALELLRKVPLSDARQASLSRFRAEHGQALADWGAWCALAEVHGPDYRSWPVALRDPRTAQAQVRGGDLATLADFHAWVQWLVAAQVETAQAAARAAGMPVGIVADLAIGSHPGGADAWAGQDLIAGGFSVGAPPDPFNQRGQDWALPPYHPGALAASGYRPLAELFGSTLAGAGGLRIDHVMGLSRLWWIPAGASPSQGAYVYYDAAGTLGTLAAAAASAGAVTIGEDLGTVEPWLRESLSARGVLGTSMLWFERGLAGEPLAPQWWRRNSLVTVSTHDLPPAAAFLSGSQVTDRLALGLLTNSEAEERAEAARIVGDWMGALVGQGLLPPVSPDALPSAEAFTAALYGYLARTPALMIGVSLAEAAGEVRSQNMPGTSTEYPNWMLPLCGPYGEPVLLEDLASSARVRAVADAAASGG